MSSTVSYSAQSISTILLGKRMIHANQFGMLRLFNESAYLSDEISEENIEIFDDRNQNDI